MIEKAKEWRRARFQGVEACLQDVRYAFRSLRKSPAFSVVAIAMLALGIGINAAVFTVINSALFEGWPLVHRNDRIVQITTTRNFVYYPDFEEWSGARSFEGVALLRGVFRTLSDGGTPETYFTTQVTTNTFQLLGVKPVLGRDFLPSDQEAGAEPVIVLRYEVWVRRFGANPAFVGRTVRIDGMPATVIGVMPKGFSFPYPMKPDLWTPMAPTPAALRRETGYAPYAFARLADGVTVEQARTEMDTIGQRLANAYPRTNQGIAPVVKSFEQWFIGEDARLLYKGMWGAVGFVLLIVCANVANLMVAHAMGRSREISIRLALGAGRWRIIRQFLAQILMVSTLAGAIGWWIAKSAVRLYALAQVNDDVLRFTMDQRVLAYLIAISIGTGLLAGLASAIYLTKLSLYSTSKDDSRGITVGKEGKRVSGLFVTAEMALAVVLLSSAGVTTRSFLNVYGADVGVNTRNVLMMALGMSPERYPKPESWIPFYRDLESRLQKLPGVESVAVAGAAPTDDLPRYAYELADAPTLKEESRATAARIVVSTGYFRTLGAKMIFGREFTNFDRGSSVPVVIVNQQFASRNWPGQVPLGKRLRVFLGNLGKEPTPWLTVVGVVSNIVQNDRTRQAFDPLLYMPHEQYPGGGMFAFVRASVPLETLSAPIRRQIYAIDSDLPVSNLMPLTERLTRAYGFERNVTALFLLFAAVALLLASVGLYATVSHSVNRRVQEIGVRVAIGATRRDILKLVLRQGMLPVGTGLAIGLTVSFAMNHVLKSQLVAVSPADPIAFAAASAVFVVTATLGCWIPARRAARVDPVIALKHE